MHICKLRFQSRTESRVFTPSLYNKCVNVRMYIVFPFQEGMKNVSMDKGFMHQFWENLSSGFDLRAVVAIVIFNMHVRPVVE